MKKIAIILFAHGARDPEWAAPIHRVREAILAQSPHMRVELSFLEFMLPNLETCASALAGEGYATILVVPMFIAQGGHLKNDIPLLMAHLRKAHPQVDFTLAAPVGEATGIVEAMADYAISLVDEGVNRP